MRSLVRLFLVLALVLAAVPVAHAAGLAEIDFSGSFLKPKDAPSTWEFGGEFLFPFGGGHLVGGPGFSIEDDADNTVASGIVEWNLMGQKGGAFVGGEFAYWLKDEAGSEDSAILARAGLKFPVAKRGLVKVYAEKVVDGRGEDDSIAGVVALGILVGGS